MNVFVSQKHLGMVGHLRYRSDCPSSAMTLGDFFFGSFLIFFLETQMFIECSATQAAATPAVLVKSLIPTVSPGIIACDV